MKSRTINYNDLAIAKEIIPFGRLRIRMLRQRMFGPETRGSQGVLVVAPCIVGDCLSYMPAVQAFAERHQTSFDLVVSPDFRPLAERLKGVRRVFVASSSYNRLSEQGCCVPKDMPTDYDLVIVLRLSRNAAEILKHIRCRTIISSDATLVRYILHLAKSSLLKRPVIQSREVMFPALGLNIAAGGWSSSGPRFEFNGEGRALLARIPAIRCHEAKVLIHTGSGWDVKQWSEDKWVELLEQIHSLGRYRFIFIGKGDQERRMCERIEERLKFKIYSLIDSLDLWELFLVMKRSDYFIGIDSGPRNLAHYADLRSVTLLNPAAVKNFLPLDGRDIVVEKPNRFPANIVNTKRGASLEQIGVMEVLEAFRKLTANDMVVRSSPTMEGFETPYPDHR